MRTHILLAFLITTNAVAKDLPRRPVDLALSPDARWGFTANARSASVSCLDLAASRVVDELALPSGCRPNSIRCVQSQSGRLLVAVSLLYHHEVALLELDPNAAEPRLSFRWRVESGRLPEGMLFSRDLRRLWVAASGDGEIVEHDTQTGEVLRRLVAIEGVRHLVVEDETAEESREVLLVAGRSEIGRIDPSSGQLLGTSSPASGRALNIGGVTQVGSRVVLAHQIKPTEAMIDPQMIVWGLIINNRITGIPIDSLRVDKEIASSKKPVKTEKVYGVDVVVAEEGHWIVPLDQRHRANGDPGRFAKIGGTIVLPSGGTDRVLIVDLASRWVEHTVPLTTEEALPSVRVGDRPTAVEIDAQERLAYVSCALDDRVDVVCLENRRVIRSIRIGPEEGPSLARRGEQIFYNSKRSRGGWYSCHSCHPDGRTDGHRFDTSSDADGLAKRAPDLLGVEETGPWAWVGTFASLEDQVAATLHKTMAVNNPAPADDPPAVMAFLRELERPRATRPGERLGGDPQKGRNLFHKAKCDTCHVPPLFTIDKLRDAGVADTYDGRTEFNPPSLRGVRDRSRWLHDGRATSLRSVFTRHDTAGKHGEAKKLTPAQLDDLIAFLRTL